MKITKTRLKQIVKEELENYRLNDLFAPNPSYTRGGADPHTAAIDALDDAIHKKETPWSTIYYLLDVAQSKIETTQGVAPGIPINDEDRKYMLNQLQPIEVLMDKSEGYMSDDLRNALKNRIKKARQNILDYEEKMNPHANDWMELYK